MEKQRKQAWDRFLQLQLAKLRDTRDVFDKTEDALKYGTKKKTY